MRFDDRLSTVLGYSAEAPRDRAVQWRQLVELVARGAGTSDPALLQRALDRISALSGEVPPAVRVAAAKAIAGPSIPLALLSRFMDQVETARPLLAEARLDDSRWADLRRQAAPSVRELMDSIRPEQPLKAVEQASTTAVREPEPDTKRVPVLELVPQVIGAEATSPGLFLWECGPTGEIDWVEGAPRAALIGRSLADDFHQRFAARLPFSDEPLVLAEEGAMAGEWRWSGTPAFFPDTGRFAGYHGVAKRGEGAEPEVRPPAIMEIGSLQGDRLRELIHELRTPLNAIIGFGEIIEGQILGPAHRAYRNRAAEIVRQARRLVAAVDDLDLAAKLQSGRSRRGAGSPVAELIAGLTGDLAPALRAKNILVRTQTDRAGLCTSLEQDLTKRLLDRFLDAVLGAAGEGEEFTLSIEERSQRIAVSLDRPRALRNVEAQALLDPTFSFDGETGLGTGFALRLVRGLATVAGGGLEIAPNKLSLQLAQAGG